MINNIQLDKNFLLFSVEPQGLVPLSNKERKHFFSLPPINREKINPGLYLSISIEEEDIGIHFWNVGMYKMNDYSIGITYKEFMDIFEKIKDREAILSEIIANKV